MTAFVWLVVAFGLVVPRGAGLRLAGGASVVASVSPAAHDQRSAAPAPRSGQSIVHPGTTPRAPAFVDLVADATSVSVLPAPRAWSMHRRADASRAGLALALLLRSQAPRAPPPLRS